MKFWNLLAFVENDQLMASAKFCEDLGFDTIGVSDHMFMPETFSSPYPHSPDGKPFFGVESDWAFPDPWVTLAGMAAITKRVKLMQSIFILPVRNPLEVARSAGTLAVQSNHRLYLCAAVGWMQDEFEIFGVDFNTRGKRTDEMIEVMRKLWRGEVVEHHGKFFDFKRLRMLPAPGDVPIIACGSNPAVMRRAAMLCDGWMDAVTPKRDLPARMAELNAMRKEAGREHLPFEVINLLSRDPSLDDVKRAQDLGVTAMQFPSPYFRFGRHSTFDENKAIWETFAENVLRHFPLK